MPPKRVCSVDSAYLGGRVVSAAVVYEDGARTETSVYRGRFTFPYVAGLFYIHEGPFAVRAVTNLSRKPDLLCLDGHGAAHPRKMGLATVCGMVAGIPSVGCAKSLLVGSVNRLEDGVEEIVLDGRRVGLVTRRGGARYWSCGFCVTTRQLEVLVRKCGLICVSAMADAHRLANEEMIRWRS